MSNESHLSIVIESRDTKQQAADLTKALEVLDSAAVRVTSTANKAGKTAQEAGNSFSKAGKDAKSGFTGVESLNKSIEQTDICREQETQRARASASNEDEDMSAITHYLALAGAAVLGTWLYGGYQYRQGYADHENLAKVQIAILNDKAHAKELALIAKVNESDAQHYQERQYAQKTIDQLRTDLATARRRLSVRVKSPVCPAQGSTTTSLDHGTARAELDGQVAQDLIGIVAEGDQALRQLNALQDYVLLLHQEDKN